MEKDGIFDRLPKKEVVGLKKEYEKLNKNLCGIREMTKLPQAIIIVDSTKEYNAIREAKKLGIPVFGLIDTNCDPDDVDYVIPANDDGVRAVRLIVGVMANAVLEGNGVAVEPYALPEEEKQEEAPRQTKPQRENRPEKKGTKKPRVAKEETVETVAEETKVEVVEQAVEPKTEETAE